eukprot:jgi/Psemu1/288329/fgenesh1_pg.253_\
MFGRVFFFFFVLLLSAFVSGFVFVFVTIPDIVKLRSALKSVDLYVAEGESSSAQPAPLLIFQEGDISDAQKETIRTWTNRTVHFPEVDFGPLPESFNTSTAREPWSKPGRSPWGYWQMCRFWITKIWEHPVVDRYSTLMRIDTDSCFLGPTHPSLPTLPKNNDWLVYAPNKDNWPASSAHNLFQTARDYLVSTNTTPANRRMWRSIRPYKRRTTKRTMPSFYNNFEILSVDFFRCADVTAFQRRITEEDPHGVFRNRWGDAPVRWLTVAIFARPRQIQWGMNRNYGHGGDCEHLWTTPFPPDAETASTE